VVHVEVAEPGGKRARKGHPEVGAPRTDGSNCSVAVGAEQPEPDSSRYQQPYRRTEHVAVRYFTGSQDYRLLRLAEAGQEIGQLGSGTPGELGERLARRGQLEAGALAPVEVPRFWPELPHYG